MHLHLVSFKTCPYVQRSVITLKHKGRDFDVTYIDLADPPAWFAEKSPLGKVPILEVTRDNETTVLFESAVINEFVDEVTGGGLLPTDPVQKARARAWVEFASECNGDYYQAATAKDAKKYAAHIANLLSKLGKVEVELHGPYFLDEFSLVDTAFAPLLQRLTQLAEIDSSFTLDSLPKVKAWQKKLLAMPEVKHSIDPEWKALNAQYLQRYDSHLAGLAA